MKVNSLRCEVQLAPRNPHGLILKNPIMTASGTFGYGIEYYGDIDIEQLGAIVCKGTTLSPQDGNPQPRIIETSCGVLNSIGLENEGVDAIFSKAATWATWKLPVIVNVAGNTIQEYVDIAQKLNGISGVAGIELNVSCPNVMKRGIPFGAEPKLVFELVHAVREIYKYPIIVKLGPNVTDITEIAIAAEEAGTDAISLINTVKAMAVNLDTLKPCLGNVYGGLSGPAIKPIALFMVYEVAKVSHLPIIGCGGISTATDVLEFICCGASAVQIGTSNMVNPNISLNIIKDLKEYMLNHNIHDIHELIGVCLS